MLNVNARNILAVYYLSSEYEKCEGKNWYNNAWSFCVHLASKCQGTSAFNTIEPNTIAAVVAALSPNNRWERNKVDTENAVYTFHRHSDLYLHPEDMASLVTVATYGSNLRKALRLLFERNNSIHDPLEILGGQKTRSFYRCIIGEDDVCVDLHAFSIWKGDRVKSKEMPSLGKALYQRIQSDYILVANYLTSLGEKVTPSQLQAITWITWRRLHKGQRRVKANA